jgi:hypothetical protein
MPNPTFPNDAQTDRVDALVDSAGVTYFKSAGRTRVVAPGSAANDAAAQLVELVGPTIFKTATATASGNTAVWTPTTGKKFRLWKFMVLLTADAYLATGPELTIKFQDNTTDIGLSFPVFVPTTAITTTPGVAFNSGWIDIGGIGIVSALANNVLSVNLSEALSGGVCGVNIAGTEE